MGKITDEELKNISDLKQEVSQVVFALGEIHYQKANLDFLESELKDKVKQIKIKELEFLNHLKEKYGNVSVNIETGEF